SIVLSSLSLSSLISSLFPYTTLFRARIIVSFICLAIHVILYDVFNTAVITVKYYFLILEKTSSTILTVFSISSSVWAVDRNNPRSEEHTSELQSRFDLVCRLLLEKKN